MHKFLNDLLGREAANDDAVMRRMRVVFLQLEETAQPVPRRVDREARFRKSCSDGRPFRDVLITEAIDLPTLGLADEMVDDRGLERFCRLKGERLETLFPGATARIEAAPAGCGRPMVVLGDLNVRGVRSERAVARLVRAAGGRIERAWRAGVRERYDARGAVRLVRVLGVGRSWGG